mgnify:CR=1 FL=1
MVPNVFVIIVENVPLSAVQQGSNPNVNSNFNVNSIFNFNSYFHYHFNFNYIWRHFDRLWDGLILSLELAFVSILIGMVSPVPGAPS